MKFALLTVASMAASSAYAGVLVIPTIPALDEFGLVTLALLVGAAGAYSIQRFRGRRKTDD
jgi:IPTL-CTERM motif